MIGSMRCHPITLQEKAFDIAEYLLESGASKRVRDIDGKTPLWLACENGDVPLADLLIRKGSGPFTSNNQDESCLHVATR